MRTLYSAAQRALVAGPAHDKHGQVQRRAEQLAQQRTLQPQQRRAQGPQV